MLIDEFLSLMLDKKGPIVLTVTCVFVKMPGEGGLNKFKRGDKYAPTPFMDGIYHLLRQHIILGGNYGKMVNEQRQREFKEYLDKMPPLPQFVNSVLTVEEFNPEQLWNGKGVRDGLFPRFVARHTETSQRYLCFRPVSYLDTGEPTPLVDEWYDAVTLRQLNFEKEIKDYYRPASKPSKVQMTVKGIPWRTVKLENIVGIRYNRRSFFIETAMGFPQRLAEQVD